MRAPALIGLFLLAGVLAASAQSKIDLPVMGSAAEQGQADGSIIQGVEDTYRVLVIGDALAGGLGAGLLRMAEAEGGIDVAVRFKEESGIARSEVYDWSTALPKIVEGNDYDAAVVLLGANDRQSIRDGNFRLAFETPDWIAAYKARIDRILDALTAAGLKVFWVSLPPMADADYEAAMRTIALYQKERVETKGARFVDIRGAFLAPDGAYTDSGPDDTGEIRKLRARDGVTFFKQGNNRLGQLVLAAIKDAKGPDPARPAEALNPDTPNLPLFGQALTGGTSLTLRPVDVKVADVLTGNGTGPGLAGRLAALRSVAVPGSAAEKLFSLGEAPPPPVGRVDDFTLPQ